VEYGAQFRGTMTPWTPCKEEKVIEYQNLVLSVNNDGFTKDKTRQRDSAFQILNNCYIF
jgi:hypothetical protein